MRPPGDGVVLYLEYTPRFVPHPPSEAWNCCTTVTLAKTVTRKYACIHVVLGLICTIHFRRDHLLDPHSNLGNRVIETAYVVAIQGSAE